ncbi:adenosine receptor A3-like [Acropora palmata]|uniref:adenosine receptor A3-like n=1 Tax=Acropora palmata TaxID=6131 RepID=UPI003DA0FD66
MEEAFLLSSISNIVFNIVLCCTAVTLNSVTIYALRKTPSVPMPLKVLLLSLAVSDLGVGMVCHPLYIARLVLDLEKSVTAFPSFYWVYLFVTSVFTYGSFFGVLSLSVDRFLALRVHLKYQQLMTQNRVMIVVISSWVLSGAMSALYSPPKIPVHIAYLVFAIIVGTCFVVSGVLNCYIYALVRRHANQIQSTQVHGNAPEVANTRRMRKSAYTTIYVYLLFLLCYLPNVSALWFVGSSRSSIAKVVKSYTFSLLLLNSSLNPLIYCWKMRDIRQTILNMMQNAFPARN